MTASIRAGRLPAGRLFVLLVLAVLTGVLGMHGLASGAASAAGGSHEMVMAAAADVPRADGGCSHLDGGAGHFDHADGTCAAAGTGAAYTPPALVGGALSSAGGASVTVVATGWTHGGRAPPDLSELQLLRI
ncbi:DUF6153 family protein [Streptomyces fructofermentans]|uniref:DUF6153 family protein n=1 Tax=Streptomyces fructofermentans TaxID=152141 RepID=UPI0033E77435